MTTVSPPPPDEVHLWVLDPDAAVDPALLAAYEALLAPDERARRDRYLFAHSKREYLLTRALQRTVLSRYAEVAPAVWSFSANEHGCPEVANPGVEGLRFNLSNTAGLIACAVSGGRDVGVDVEDTQRKSETVAVADRFFAPAEVAALRALPAEAQRARFFDYWTLKEAYIKARRMGLAIPLASFAFVLDEGRPVRVELAPELGDDAATWQFEQPALTKRHRAAVAVRRGRGPDVALVVRWVVPLG
jgi:4'-phosphopantetheinyl transferase